VFTTSYLPVCDFNILIIIQNFSKVWVNLNPIQENIGSKYWMFQSIGYQLSSYLSPRFLSAVRNMYPKNSKSNKERPRVVFIDGQEKTRSLAGLTNGQRQSDDPRRPKWGLRNICKLSIKTTCCLSYYYQIILFA
jgi:hypothetical protein